MLEQLLHFITQIIIIATCSLDIILSTGWWAIHRLGKDLVGLMLITSSHHGVHNSGVSLGMDGQRRPNHAAIGCQGTEQAVCCQENTVEGSFIGVLWPINGSWGQLEAVLHVDS